MMEVIFMHNKEEVDIKKMKSDLRNMILTDLEDISEDVRNFFSEELAKKLVKMEEITSKDNIMIFLSFKNEIVTDYIFDGLKKLGKNIYVPVTDFQNKRLRICKLENLDDVEINSYSIREPKTKNEVSPEILDLIIAPGVAFDPDLRRIGYGGGYYDKLFENIRPSTKKIAICFDEQIVNKVPTEEHDHRVDMIVTPTKTYRGRFSKLSFK